MTLPSLLASLTARLGAHQAALELRWMKHAAQSPAPPAPLAEMLKRRVSGEPLQYILGTQPFGPLNLLARPPVLIPRPETEHWVLKLADVLSTSAQTPLRLLDLGTGSGCIPLLLCHTFSPGTLHATGVDVAPHAIALAKDNAVLCNIPSRSDPLSPKNTFNAIGASFLSDTFPEPELSLDLPFHVLTSNPRTSGYPENPWSRSGQKF